jgi:hypothetical protein
VAGSILDCLAHNAHRIGNVRLPTIFARDRCEPGGRLAGLARAETVRQNSGTSSAECDEPKWSERSTLITFRTRLRKNGNSIQRTYRTRKPRLRRLNPLFTIDIRFPKLDVAGSNPVSRSRKIKQLASPPPPCTPLYSIYITTSACSSWSTITFRCSTGDFVYTF